MNTLVVNLFAGPCAGKSTTAADLFAELKYLGVDCEMALEYAKDKVWEKSYHILENQIYIFGKQLHRVNRLVGQVEVIITDSPLLFSILYGCHETYAFKALVLEVFHRYENVNFLLERTMKYNENGRMQTEKQARALDAQIKELLDQNHVEYQPFISTKENVEKILVPAIMNKLGH